ncbi:hypothetical protein BDR26DRAFT_92689 [Obelidium mucronatum]|nr:hypothetical protein BDR26DRAFT_92689 [Obelidium mucronatum]
MSKIASDAAPFTRPSGSDWSTAPAESVEHFVSKLNALLAKEGAAVELDGLPAGYELLQQRRTTGNHVDRYLYGHSNGTSRFRSVNEFVPHVLFLAGGRAAECRCKYCGGGSGGGPRQAAAASAAAAATPAKNGDAPPRQAKTERKRTSADAAVGAQPPDAAKPAARRQTWNSQSTAALLEVAVEDNSNKNNNSDSKTKKANVFADPFFKFKKAQPAEALPKPASKKPTPKKPAPLSASAAESSSETSFKTVSVDPSFKFKKVDDSQPASASAKSPKMTAETTSMPPVSVSPSIKSPVPPPSQPKPPISVAPVAPPPTAPAASTVAPTRSIANPLARKLSITSIDVSCEKIPFLFWLTTTCFCRHHKSQNQLFPLKTRHKHHHRNIRINLRNAVRNRNYPYLHTWTCLLRCRIPSSLPSAPLSATERSLPTATDAPITTQPISASQKITPAISDEKKLERGPSAEDISKAQALLFKKSNDDLQEMKARQKALAPKPPLQNKQIVVPTNIPTLQKALPSASVPTKTASLPPPNPAVPQPPNQQNPQPIPTQSVPKKRKLNGTNLPVSNPATQESKPGNPTTPIFRVNDLVFIEVLITSKYPEQTHLTLPNTAHPKSKPLTINIQSIHDTCVFWPAVIRQVHQFTPQRILWTTPIMIETTTTPANLNLSTAACFGDTIETLTRDVENGVQVTRRHRRPSYTVSLLCITNGQVVLPELYITPWRFVSVPKDLFPAGFEMGLYSC